MSGKQSAVELQVKKAASLIICFPGLRVPKAMQAAKFWKFKSQNTTIQMQVRCLYKKELNKSFQSSKILINHCHTKCTSKSKNEPNLVPPSSQHHHIIMPLFLSVNIHYILQMKSYTTIKANDIDVLMCSRKNVLFCFH